MIDNVVEKERIFLSKLEILVLLFATLSSTIMVKMLPHGVEKMRLSTKTQKHLLIRIRSMGKCLENWHMKLS